MFYFIAKIITFVVINSAYTYNYHNCSVLLLLHFVQLLFLLYS